jgi:hypothetical protein
MKLLIKKLHEISEKYSIEDNFVWDIPKDCPLFIPDDITNNFQKNIYLKENLHTFLEQDVTLDGYYWIIQEWGGIKSLKKNNKNNEKLIKFKQQLKTGKLTKETFGLISSFSKVASFLEPAQYAIYDSRVIYSLNWLIFRYLDNKIFFPQPIGRSSALAKYDMQTIFRLSKLNYEYKSHKTAFFEYCSLLSKLSKAIYGNGKLYNVEMLLFLIAPEYIVNDIEKSIKISII